VTCYLVYQYSGSNLIIFSVIAWFEFERTFKRCYMFYSDVDVSHQSIVEKPVLAYVQCNKQC